MEKEDKDKCTEEAGKEPALTLVDAGSVFGHVKVEIAQDMLEKPTESVHVNGSGSSTSNGHKVAPVTPSKSAPDPKQMRVLTEAYANAKPKKSERERGNKFGGGGDKKRGGHSGRGRGGANTTDDKSNWRTNNSEFRENTRGRGSYHANGRGNGHSVTGVKANPGIQVHQPGTSRSQTPNTQPASIAPSSPTMAELMKSVKKFLDSKSGTTCTPVSTDTVCSSNGRPLSSAPSVSSFDSVQPTLDPKDVREQNQESSTPRPPVPKPRIGRSTLSLCSVKSSDDEPGTSSRTLSQVPSSSETAGPSTIGGSLNRSNEALVAVPNGVTPEVTHNSLLSLVNKMKAEREAGLNQIPATARSHSRTTTQGNLPVFNCRDDLIAAVRNNQFLIIIGEAGCGKSTQIPQFLLDARLNRGKHSKLIGITQPRRLAASMLATRVARERGVRVGDEVGYAVRFENKVSNRTLIKYMTDGMFVRECLGDHLFSQYTIIIVDEAHERHQETDLCFGLLKRAAESRADLKVVICSATLNEEKFKNYFDCPVFTIPKTQAFKVYTHYLPESEYFPYEEDCFAYVADKVLEISRRCSKGVILVFLSGQEEIENMTDLLESTPNQLLITPCFGNLPYEEQQKIFLPTPRNRCKVVLATNVAETSITIDDVTHVIDTGFFKQNEYDSESGLYNLVKQPISRFQAIQREGRAGRTVAGECYRMYTEKDFEEMDEATLPEMMRSNLDDVVLLLLSMKIDPTKFKYMDEPESQRTIGLSTMHLMQMTALELNHDTIKVSPLGQRMARLPLDPELSRSVLESEKLGCSKEVIIIASILSTQCKNLFNRDVRWRQQAAQAKERFIDREEGDLVTLLKLYQEWMGNNRSEEWCKNNFLQSKILQEANEIRKQITKIVEKTGNTAREVPPDCPREVLNENIRRAFTAGYFRHLCKKRGVRGAYRTCVLSKSEDVFLSQDSALSETKPEWIIFIEVKKTRKAFIREAFPVDPNWVSEYDPDHVAFLQEQRILQS